MAPIIARSRRPAVAGAAVTAVVGTLALLLLWGRLPGLALDLANARPLAAGAVFPDTPAGRRYADWLRAVNSGDAETLRWFHRFASPPWRLDARVAQDLSIFRETGGLDVHRLLQASNREVTALLHARLTDTWAEVGLRLDPWPLDTIAGFRTVPVPAPPDGGVVVPRDNRELAEMVGTYLERLAAADVFSGVVLVARDGEPVLTGAYGLADRERRVPNNVDTMFNLGSMNKMFTAVAVAQLAEQGRLSFGDPVIEHLPDYPRPEVASAITLHQLLTHTSGLDDYINEQFFAGGKDRLRTVWDYVPLYVDDPLLFAPGSGWAYSNAGFALLGAIVERVSGQDYFSYVREHIYQPAGMRNTDAYERDRPVENLAIGYLRGELTTSGLGPRRANTPTLPLKGGPAGGGYSTAPDLLRFANALLAQRLLGEELTERALSPQVRTGRADERYGYGFQVEGAPDDRIVGHSGGAPGVSARLQMYLDRGYTVIVLSQYDGAAGTVAAWLRDHLP